MQPWKSMIKPDQVEVVSPEGEVRSSVLAYYAGDHFVIDDMAVDVRPGDELRRRLPNGNEEAFRVDDPKYYDGHFGKHYQVKVSRPMTYPPKAGGNYSIHVSGANARVNIHSTDASTNAVHEVTVFNQARELLAASNIAPERMAEIEVHIGAMEKARSRSKFSEAYQAFIASTADHIAVFGPILAGLALIIPGLPHP